MGDDLREGLQYIRHIDKELGEIRSRTGGTWRPFRNGILQGMGAIVGSLAAVALIGLILYIFGVIPGFSSLAAYVHSLMDHTSSRL